MTLRVATVLSAREWESRLVAAARASASVRLVLRAFLPTEVAEQAEALDVVVVGSETPWATAARLASWRRSGISIVGVHPAGDRPAASRLRSADVDLLMADDIGPEAMLREIRMLEPAAPREQGAAALVAVTGPRGAPGRTEVAVTLAAISSRRLPTVLVDADLEAPGVAIRLGIPPRPDLSDAVEEVHEQGAAPDSLLQRVDRLQVLPGSHRPEEPPLRSELVFDVVDSLRTIGVVVVDTGPWPAGREIVKSASSAVIVVDGTPTGVVRAATLAAAWTGPPPQLIVNRVGRSHHRDVIAAIRRWTGLEPVAVVPPLPAVSRSARRGRGTSRQLHRHLAGVAR